MCSQHSQLKYVRADGSDSRPYQHVDDAAVARANVFVCGLPSDFLRPMSHLELLQKFSTAVLRVVPPKLHVKSLEQGCDDIHICGSPDEYMGEEQQLRARWRPLHALCHELSNARVLAASDHLAIVRVAMPLFEPLANKSASTPGLAGAGAGIRGLVRTVLALRCLSMEFRPAQIQPLESKPLDAETLDDMYHDVIQAKRRKTNADTREMNHALQVSEPQMLRFLCHSADRACSRQQALVTTIQTTDNLFGLDFDGLED